MDRELKALKVDAKVEGSCNHCQSRSEEYVYMIEVRACSFRLCEKCMREMLNKIQKVYDPL